MSESRFFKCDTCPAQVVGKDADNWLYVTVSQLGVDYGEDNVGLFGEAKLHLCVACSEKPIAPKKLRDDFFAKGRGR
jgi:hypothetical protein